MSTKVRQHRLDPAARSNAAMVWRPIGATSASTGAAAAAWSNSSRPRGSCAARQCAQVDDRVRRSAHGGERHQRVSKRVRGEGLVRRGAAAHHLDDQGAGFPAFASSRGSSNGRVLAPGTIMPRTSAIIDIVSAVPMTLHAPCEQPSAASRPCQSRSPILPFRRSSQYFHRSVPHPPRHRGSGRSCGSRRSAGGPGGWRWPRP